MEKSYDPHVRFFALYPPLPVPPPLPVVMIAPAAVAPVASPPTVALPAQAPVETEAAALSRIAARVYPARAAVMGREPEAEPAKPGPAAWPDADEVYKRRAAALAPKAKTAG